MSHGTLIGGMGISWAVPVYILNGHFPDAFSADKDPVPFDGEPHTDHGPVIMGRHPIPQGELQGVAGNLGFIGGNPHPALVHQLAEFLHGLGGNHHNVAEGMDVDANNDDNHQNVAEGMDADADNDDAEWPAWNPAAPAAPVVPQHPNVQQDHLDLNLSGSSMRFLRGGGSGISLDDILDIAAHTEDSSSSSSDATSQLNEDRARFAAAQQHCVNTLIFNRKGLPDDVFHRATQLLAHGPIIIDREALPAEIF